MSWNVLLTANALEEVEKPAREILEAAGCRLTLHLGAGWGHPEELPPLLEDKDAVLAGVEPYSAELLAGPAAARLKLISRWGVGVDAVNLAAATQQGIVVTNTPGLLDEAVADYTWALLLALARRVPRGHATMRAGEWQTSWGPDVNRKTLGIIGCGRIGTAVARRGTGFGMRLLSHDPSPPDSARAMGVEFVDLNTLLAESDFVCLHTALTPQTRGLIGGDQLRRMKPTACLINTARGALVDEVALMEALEAEALAGAALDAYVREPLPADHPLRRTPRLILTPHQASFGYQTGARVSQTAAQAIVDLMEGRQPRFVVNPDVLSTPGCRAKIQAG